MVPAVVVGAKDGLEACDVEEGNFSKVEYDLRRVCDIDPVECGHHLPYAGKLEVTDDPENQDGA